MNAESPLPTGTPAAVLASVGTSAVAQVSFHSIDPHDVALYITIVSGSLSIIISVATVIAVLGHFFKKPK